MHLVNSSNSLWAEEVRSLVSNIEAMRKLWVVSGAAWWPTVFWGGRFYSKFYHWSSSSKSNCGDLDFADVGGFPAPPSSSACALRHLVISQLRCRPNQAQDGFYRPQDLGRGDGGMGRFQRRRRPASKSKWDRRATEATRYQRRLGGCQRQSWCRCRREGERGMASTSFLEKLAC